jgi:hypothetical protein
MIPGRGRELIAMRLASKRPPGFVVVTEHHAIAERFRHPRCGMFALTFNPGESYDWRMLHGLDVRVITELERPLVAPLCQAILGIEPTTLYVTYRGKYADEYDAIIPYESAR